MIAAHVGGVPVEEILPSVIGAGGALLLVRAWIEQRLQRRRRPRSSLKAASSASIETTASTSFRDQASM